MAIGLQPVGRDRARRAARPRRRRSAPGRRRARRHGCPAAAARRVEPVVERTVERDGHQHGHDGAEHGDGPVRALTGSGLIASSRPERQPKDRPCRRTPPPISPPSSPAGGSGCAPSARRRPDAARLRGGPGRVPALPGRSSRRAGECSPTWAGSALPISVPGSHGATAKAMPAAPPPGRWRRCAASSATPIAGMACTIRRCRRSGRRACRTACPGRWPRPTPAS